MVEDFDDGAHFIIKWLVDRERKGKEKGTSLIV